MSAAEELRAYVVECDVSDRRDWLALRRTGLGASEIASVLGVSPWVSPLELYAMKTSGHERDLSDVEAVYWGNKLEAPIIEAYSERTGRNTRKAGQLLRSRKHPWAMATLDAETWEAANDADGWPFEVKNTSSFKSDEWADGPPEHYRLQCMQQMLVTGAQRATIAALIGGQRMVWADIPRDEDTIRKIVYHGERFWDRVMRRDMPAPDGTESAKRALSSLYPEGSGMVVLPATARDAADELEALKSQRSTVEKQIALIENTVKAAIGDCEIGFMTDGRSFSWKLQHRRSFTTEASSFRVLRLHRQK